MFFRVSIVTLLFATQCGLAVADSVKPAPRPAPTVSSAAPILPEAERQYIQEQLGTLQKRVNTMRAKVAGKDPKDATTPSLDLAQESIKIIQRIVSNDKGKRPSRQELLVFLDKAQKQLDAVKAGLPDTPENELLREKLAASEARIDRARRLLLSVRQSPIKPVRTKADVEALYERAQRQLVELRVKAESLPATQAKVLKAQLDEAQRRLDAAHARVLADVRNPEFRN